ncbi:MAG: hypothetical protein M3Z35_07735 [Nitrospirota bacterium]|nr:hypothetical protein [Nitrospirota bacterium]
MSSRKQRRFHSSTCRTHNVNAFLRDIEHKLQMVHDLQAHALSDSPDELVRCAIRLGYPPEDRQAAMAAFLKDHQSHATLSTDTLRS